MLSLGVVPYLNALPLYRTLETGGRASIVRAVPAKLGAHLQSSVCVAALLPIVDHFRDPQSFLVSDACIGSDGAVRSVLLFSRVSVGDIVSVAADNSSHTSVALMRVLLADTFGIRPLVFDREPDLEFMLAANDAALLIGDAALEAAQCVPAGVRVTDLGDLWKMVTGLPFVYAAWVAREAVPENLGEELSAARDAGEATLPRIVAENPIPTRLTSEQIEDYLRHAVTFHLDDAHRAGMEEFRVRCVRHGLV